MWNSSLQIDDESEKDYLFMVTFSICKTWQKLDAFVWSESGNHHNKETVWMCNVHTLKTFSFVYKERMEPI